MATEKEIKLVKQLLDKTRKKILSWEPTAEADAFLQRSAEACPLQFARRCKRGSFLP